MKTILICDDDPGVLLLVKRILARGGYTVLGAASAAEALSIAQDPRQIDLLLSDVMLPGMIGPLLAAKLKEWLNKAPHFIWTNLSVPKHDPITTSEKLTRELNNQMWPADAFLILGGMYYSHSDWIQCEVNFARRIGRPIIGIRPWRSFLIPSAVQNGADEIVGWNSASIVGAIRRHALAQAFR